MPHLFGNDILPGIVLRQPGISELNDALYRKNRIHIYLLRLDEIHPVVSGNKLFKLYYFLEEAKKNPGKRIITFGGAYSNHLAATAFACRQMKINCIGIVRGEKPVVLSPTLVFCIQQGMQLEYISRTEYRSVNEPGFLADLQRKYGDSIVIPEGGFSIKGKEGASLIMKMAGDKKFSHVCVPVGTATTFAGIIEGNDGETETIGFSVLKNVRDIDSRLRQLATGTDKKYTFNGDYHFGGYARKTDELISFMNSFYRQHQIPLDFVYTAKMMFGVNDLVQKKYFHEGDTILCVHTGGLQGNNSLPNDTLVY